MFREQLLLQDGWRKAPAAERQRASICRATSRLLLQTAAAALKPVAHEGGNGKQGWEVGQGKCATEEEEEEEEEEKLFLMGTL